MFQTLRTSLKQSVLGQDDVIDHLLMGLLAEGHVLKRSSHVFNVQRIRYRPIYLGWSCSIR